MSVQFGNNETETCSSCLVALFHWSIEGFTVIPICWYLGSSRTAPGEEIPKSSRV